MILAMWKDKGGGALPLLLVLICLGSVHTTSDVTVTLNTRKVLATLDERFLSFTVDPEELATRKYGPISQSMAYALSPAYLRIAGPSSNNYTLDGDHITLNSHVFYAHAWKDLNVFLNASGINVVLCLNVLNRLHNVWDSSKAVEIVNTIEKMGLQVDYQLGYENQEYLLELSSDEVAHNVIRLRSILDAFTSTKSARVVGPDFTQFDPKSPEETSFVRNFVKVTNGNIDAITVHPSFSLEDDVTTAVAKAMDVFDEALFVKTGAKKRPIWLAESELELKDPGFTPTMNSLVALGEAAQSGAALFLLRPQPFFPEFTTPDFWMAALYKALVGSVVLSARSSSAQLHTFVHCTRAASESNPNNYEPGAVTIFGANHLATDAQLTVRTSPGKDEAAHVFVLTHDESTGKSYLNDKELIIAPNGEFPIITPIEQELLSSALGKSPLNNAIQIRKRSIFFIVLPENRAKLCMGKERSNSVAQTIGNRNSNARNVAKSLLSKLGGLKATDNPMTRFYDNPADNFDWMYPKSSATKISTTPDGKEIKTKYVTFSDNDWLSKFPEKIHKNTLFDDDFPKTSVLDMNKYNRYRRHKHSHLDDDSEEFDIDGLHNHDGENKPTKDNDEESSEIHFEFISDNKGPQYGVQNKVNDDLKNQIKIEDKSSNEKHESLEWNLENIGNSDKTGKNDHVSFQSDESDSMFHGNTHETLHSSELFPELEFMKKDKEVTDHNETANVKTNQEIPKNDIDPEIVEISKKTEAVEEHNENKNKGLKNIEPHLNVTNERQSDEIRNEIKYSLNKKDDKNIQNEDYLHDQNLLDQNSTVSAEIMEEERTGIDSAENGDRKIADYIVNRDELSPVSDNGTGKIYNMNNSINGPIHLDLNNSNNQTNFIDKIILKEEKNQVVMNRNNITDENHSTMNKNEKIPEKEIEIEITTLSPTKTQATTNIMKIPRKKKMKRDTRNEFNRFMPILNENGNIEKRNKTKVEREIQNEMVFVPQISVFDSNFHRLGVLDNIDEKENKKIGNNTLNDQNNTGRNGTVHGKLQEVEVPKEHEVIEQTHLVENNTESIGKLLESNATTSTLEDEFGKNKTTAIQSTIEQELIDIHKENDSTTENEKEGSVRVSENKKRSPIYSNYLDFSESFLAPSSKGVKTLVNYPSYKNIIHHAASYPPYKINDKDITHSSMPSVASLLPKFKSSNGTYFGSSSTLPLKTNNNETVNEITKFNDTVQEHFNKTILEENENKSYKTQGINKTENLQIELPINANDSSNIGNELQGDKNETDKWSETATGEKDKIQKLDLNEKINKIQKEDLHDIGSISSNTLGIALANSHAYNDENIKSYYKRNHGTFKSDYQNTLSKNIPDIEDEERQDIENVRNVKASKRKIPMRQYYDDYENEFNEKATLDHNSYEDEDDNDDDEEKREKDYMENTQSYDSEFHKNNNKIKKTKKYGNDQNQVKDEDKDILEMMDQLSQLEDDIKNYNHDQKKYGKKIYSGKEIKEDEGNEYEESDEDDTQGGNNAEEELFFKNLLLFKNINVPMYKSTDDSEELKSMGSNVTSINNMADIPINDSNIIAHSTDRETLLKSNETKIKINDDKPNNLLDELIDDLKSNSYDEKVQSKRILRNINNDNYNNLGVNPKSKYYKLNSNREYIPLYPYIYNSTHNQLLDFNSNKQNEHLVVPNVSPTFDFNDPLSGTETPTTNSPEKTIDNVESETIVNVAPNSVSMFTIKSPDKVHSFDSSFAQLQSVESELNYRDGKNVETSPKKVEIKQPSLTETTNKEYNIPISKSENIPLTNFQDNGETDLFKHGYRSDTPFLYDFFKQQQSKDHKDPLIVYPSVLPKEAVKTDVDVSKSYSKSYDYGNKGTVNQYNAIENVSKVKNENNYDVFNKLQSISESENSEKKVTIKSKQKENKQNDEKTKEVDVIAEMQKAIFPNGVNKVSQDKKLDKKPKTLTEKIKALKQKKENLRKSKSKKEIGNVDLKNSSEVTNESIEMSKPEFFILNKEIINPQTVKNKTKISKIKKPEDYEYLKKEEEIIKQKDKQNKDDEIPMELLKLDHDLELEEIKRNNRGILSTVATKPEHQNAITFADKILGGVQNFMQKLDPLAGNRAETIHEEPKKKHPLKPKRKPLKLKKPLIKNNKLKDWKANLKRPQPFKAQKIFPTKYPRKTSPIMPIFSKNKRNIYKNRFETKKNVMKRDISELEQNFIKSNRRKKRHNVNIQQDENDNLLDEIYNDKETQKENHRYTRHILPDFLPYDLQTDVRPGRINYEYENVNDGNMKNEKTPRYEITDDEVKPERINYEYEYLKNGKGNNNNNNEEPSGYITDDEVKIKNLDTSNENSDTDNNVDKKDTFDFNDVSGPNFDNSESNNNPIDDLESEQTNSDISDNLFKEYLNMRNIYKRSNSVANDKKPIRNKRDMSFDIISPSFFEKYKTYVKSSLDIIHSLAKDITKNNTNKNIAVKTPNNSSNNLERPKTQEENEMLSTNFMPQKKRPNKFMETNSRLDKNYDLVQYNNIKDLLGEEIRNDLYKTEEIRNKRSSENLNNNNIDNLDNNNKYRNNNIDNEIDDIDIQLLKTNQDKKFNYFEDFALKDKLKYYYKPFDSVSSEPKLNIDMTKNFKDEKIRNDTIKPFKNSTTGNFHVMQTLQTNNLFNNLGKQLPINTTDYHNQTIKSSKTNSPNELSINATIEKIKTQVAPFILPHSKPQLVNISKPQVKTFRLVRNRNMPRSQIANFGGDNNIKKVAQYKNVKPTKKIKLYLKNINRFKRAKRTISNKFLELNIQPLTAKDHNINSEKSSKGADYSDLTNFMHALRTNILKTTNLDPELTYRSNLNDDDILNMVPKNEYEEIIKNEIEKSKLDKERAESKKLDNSQEKINNADLLEHIELLKNNNSKLIKDFSDYLNGIQVEKEAVPLNNKNENIRKYQNVFHEVMQDKHDVLLNPSHFKDLNYLTELLNEPISKDVLKDVLAKVKAEQKKIFDDFKETISPNSESETGKPAGNIIDTIVINPFDHYLTKINQDLGNVLNITSQANTELNNSTKILKEKVPLLLKNVFIEFGEDGKNRTENNESNTLVEEPIHRTTTSQSDNESTKIQNDSKENNTNMSENKGTNNMKNKLLGFSNLVYATTQDIFKSFKKALGF